MDLIYQTDEGSLFETKQPGKAFEKHRLETCCEDHASLIKSTEESNASVINFPNGLSKNTRKKVLKRMPFIQMSGEQLINYLLIHHYYHLKQSIGHILSHFSKITARHTEEFAWIDEGAETFNQLQRDFISYLHEAEFHLFPLIKEQEFYYHEKKLRVGIKNMELPIDFKKQGQIQLLESLRRMAKITHYYAPCKQACTIHRQTLRELKEFEENIQDVFKLESEILFPLAIKIYNEMTTA